MAVICKKCGGQHPMWDCKATAAQITAYKNRGGSSAVEPRPSKPLVEGSTPSLRSKKSRPVRTDQTAAQNTSTKQRSKPAAKAGAGSRPRSAPAAKSQSSKLSAADPPRSGSAVRKGAEATTAKVGNVGASAGRSHSRLSRVPTESPASVPAEPHRGRGRPKTIVDMRAYKAQKERERRARLKQEKSK